MDRDPWHRLREDMTESSSRSYKEVLWPNTAIYVFLLKFEDMCFNVSQGRLGKTHWGQITDAVNASCSSLQRIPVQIQVESSQEVLQQGEFAWGDFQVSFL